MSKTGKYVTIFMWAIIIITSILAVAFIANISDNKNDPAMNSWLSTNLVWAYILLIFSVVILVAFAVYQMVSDFAAAKKGLMSLLFFGVVALISYLIASNKMPTFLGAQKFIEDGTITPSKMKLIDAGLIGTYIVLGISIASIVYASVSRFFK